ncbi:MAG: DUF4345 family protein [Pseudomonadota bacterium]
MPAKIILWLSVVMLGLYGLSCFFNANLAADYAGLAITNTDARIEMIAMYGGLQTAVALFCLLGVMKPAQYQQPALLLLVLIFGGLALGRAYGLLMGSEGAGIYTHGALGYEVFTLLFAAFALRQQSQAAN